MSEKVYKDLGQEVLKIIGSILCTISGAILFVHTLSNAIATTNIDDQISYIMLVFVGAVVMPIAFFLVIERWTAREANAVGLALFFLVIFTVSIFIAPRPSVVNVQIINGVGIGGSLVILIAKKPNFGPEANRRIYQSVGGWIAFVISIIVLVVGIYIASEGPGSWFDISRFAGNGTYPDNFHAAYINSDADATAFYNEIKDAGAAIIVGAIIIMVSAIFRNRLTLKIASITLTAGIITCLVGFSVFQDSYYALDLRFSSADYAFSNVYELQLQLKDTGLFTFGVVMVCSAFVSLFLLVYASFASKPLEKWRLRRDRYIAAAEVSIREQRLDKAVKYLEMAAHWSSRVEEEDKAVELLTKVRQIEKKAIAMRKAEAAKEKKKELAALQKQKAKEKSIEVGKEKKEKTRKEKSKVVLPKLSKEQKREIEGEDEKKKKKARAKKAKTEGKEEKAEVELTGDEELAHVNYSLLGFITEDVKDLFPPDARVYFDFMSKAPSKGGMLKKLAGAMLSQFGADILGDFASNLKGIGNVVAKSAARMLEYKAREDVRRPVATKMDVVSGVDALDKLKKMALWYFADEHIVYRTVKEQFMIPYNLITAWQIDYSSADSRGQPYQIEVTIQFQDAKKKRKLSFMVPPGPFPIEDVSKRKAKKIEFYWNEYFRAKFATDLELLLKKFAPADIKSRSNVEKAYGDANDGLANLVKELIKAEEIAKARKFADLAMKWAEDQPKGKKLVKQIEKLREKM